MLRSCVLFAGLALRSLLCVARRGVGVFIFFTAQGKQKETKKKKKEIAFLNLLCTRDV
jgi:hypothetical protein